MGRVAGVLVVGLGDGGLDDICVRGNAVGSVIVAIDIFLPRVCSAKPCVAEAMTRKATCRKRWRRCGEV
jgi:hypothetical protein